MNIRHLTCKINSIENIRQGNPATKTVYNRFDTLFRDHKNSTNQEMCLVKEMPPVSRCTARHRDRCGHKTIYAFRYLKCMLTTDSYKI